MCECRVFPSIFVGICPSRERKSRASQPSRQRLDVASTFSVFVFLYALHTAALLALTVRPYLSTHHPAHRHTRPAHDKVPFTFLSSSLFAYLRTPVPTAAPVPTVRGMVPVQRARESEMAAPLRAFSSTIPHARHNAADLHPRAPHVGARASCLLVSLSRGPADLPGHKSMWQPSQDDQQRP